MTETGATLDDLEQMRQADPENMYQCIHDFPEHIQQAAEIGASWQINPADFTDIQNITLLGMGGSAIGGDLLRNLLGGALNVPFLVNRNYTLPKYVNKNSLVITSSYSGNTEETLSAFAEANSRGAKIVALFTGGKLEESVGAKNIPHVTLPIGYQPRAALAFSLIPTLYFLETAGFIKGYTSNVSDTVAHLRSTRKTLLRESALAENSAKKLALMLHGRIPLIYSSVGVIESVAVRWRGQMSENAKTIAYSNTFPEMNHNELVGWSEKIEPFRDKIAVVLLRDEEDHPRVKFRLDHFAELVQKLHIPIQQVSSTGDSSLSGQLSLVQFGDFVSYYLAALNRVDPTPVSPIEDLKESLAQI